MTRSELTYSVAEKAKDLKLSFADVRKSLDIIFDEMSASFKDKEGRIEIRGFGSFSVRQYDSQSSRNPKTGENVGAIRIISPHFKPGKDLKRLVNKK